MADHHCSYSTEELLGENFALSSLDFGVNLRNQGIGMAAGFNLATFGNLEAWRLPFPAASSNTSHPTSDQREEQNLPSAFGAHAKGANAWLGRMQEGRGDRSSSRVGRKHSRDQPAVGQCFPDCCPSRTTYSILGIITYHHLVYYYT